MRRLLPLIVAALAALGYGYKNGFRIEGLQNLRIQGPQATAPSAPGEAPPPLADRTNGTIRICSFNIQVFGTAKLAKPAVMNALAEVVRRFDVVAIQEVRTKTNDLLPQFVALINSTGRHYDYVIGPRLGRTVSTEQYAYIFDTASIEVDRQSLYTVDDPDDLLHREPLVAWMRVRGPSPEQAFTFSLVNIHTDPDEVAQELSVLDDVFRAVQRDGRGEDDVILLGDLNADDRHFGQLGQVSQITWALSQVPTNTRGDKMYDNLVFSRSATSEFTGRAGVFDLVREFNLTTDQALEISDHMPVWAEFSIFEGGQPGRVAAQPEPAGR